MTPSTVLTDKKQKKPSQQSAEFEINAIRVVGNGNAREKGGSMFGLFPVAI